MISDEKVPGNWPPPHFAVLQNGDGQGEYYRQREVDESEEVFAERIGRLVARDIVGILGTAFVEVIDGRTGETDQALTDLVVTAMERHKILRSQQKRRA